MQLITSPDNQFHDGNPATGALGTFLAAVWHNAVQAEIAAPILAAGMTLDPNNNAQLLAAILALIEARSGNYLLDTGSVNACVVAMNPAVTAYTNGLPVQFRIAHAITGACTLNAGPGAVPLLRDDGTPTQNGDAPSGSILSGTFDSTANGFLLDSIVPSQIATEIAAILNAGVQSAGPLNGINNPNLLLNGSGEFGASGWTLGTQFQQQTDTSLGIGTYFANTTALATYTNSSVSPTVAVGANAQMTETIEVANAASVGTVNVSFAAFNSSGTFISNLAALNIPNGTARTRYTLSGTTPAGTAYVETYVNFTGVTAAAYGVAWRRVKVEVGATPSLYSQEASLASLASLFTGASLGTSGYQKLPGGLMIQWTTIVASTGWFASWPIAFPNACIAALATNIDTGPSYCSLYGMTKTGTNGNRWSASGAGVSGTAQILTIGY